MTKGSIFTTILKYLVLITVIGYLGFAIFKVSHSTDDILCTGLEFEVEDSSDNALIGEEEIKNIIAANKIAPKGQTFGNIDLKKIDSLVSTNPYVDSVITYRSSIGRLCVHIKPKRPVLHVFPDNGKEFYLDREGSILPAGGLNTNLCVVTGNVTQKYAKENLLSLGKILCNDPYWKLQAQQVNITKDGKVQMITRVGSHTILLGSPDNFANKLERIRLFYDKGLSQVGWNKYKTISAEYDGQVICTKK